MYPYLLFMFPIVTIIWAKGSGQSIPSIILQKHYLMQSKLLDKQVSQDMDINSVPLSSVYVPHSNNSFNCSNSYVQLLSKMHIIASSFT